MSEHPKQRVIRFKRHAHLFTLISVVWTVVSLLAVSVLRENPDHDYRIYSFGIGVLVVHSVCIGLSVYFWRTEQESVLMTQEEHD